MPQIFISYSRADVAQMSQIAAGLRLAGLDIWTDEALTAGTPAWEKAIIKALRQADCLVVLLSPEAADSDWVRRELTFADQIDLRIFPILIRGDEVDSIPLRLMDAQYVDARPDLAAGLAQLVAALMAYVGRELPPVPEMVTVPAGSFLMGSNLESDPLADENELPQQEIMLPTYEIGRYPITTVEYRAFVDAGGYDQAEWWTEAGWQWKTDTHQSATLLTRDVPGGLSLRYPVAGVCWYEAWAYTQWLSAALGRSFRLPTEAEWEKAARGANGRIYPWGDEFDPILCNSDNRVMRITPVSMYSPGGDSPYQCVEMAGNVWEWCLTRWRANHAAAPDALADDPSGKAARVLRGGSWYNSYQDARCAARIRYLPYDSYATGFRIVCDLPES